MVLDRRNILKFIAGGAVGTMLTPVPYRLADDLSIWTQNWPWLPSPQEGRRKTVPSMLKMGGPEYGISVTTYAGRPVTAQGNPDHPLSRGGIGPLGAGSVQLMYSPARINGPLRRTSSGKFTSVSWSDARDLLAKHLTQAAEEKDRIACISGDETGSSFEIWSAFLQAMNSEALYFLPTDSGVHTRVWNDMMQGRGVLGLDIDTSDCILVLGPDLLGCWGNVVLNQAVFGKRQPELYYAGPVQNATAAVAREWFPVAALSLGHLALAVTYHLLPELPASPGVRGFSSFSALVRREYSPRKATQKTGLGPRTVSRIARRLIQARHPLIVSGSPTGQGAPGFTHWAGLCLNLILDRINAPGGLPALPPPPSALPQASPWTRIRSRDLAAAIYAAGTWEQNPPRVLFCFEANPAYSLPNTRLTNDFLNMVELKVSFSQFMDETAARSDLILPHPYFLERQDDSYVCFAANQAVYSVSPQVVSPHTDCRSAPDFLLDLAAHMGASLGPSSFQDMLKSKASALGADWGSLRKGKATWTSDRRMQDQDPTLWSPQIEDMALAAQKHASSPGLILAPDHQLKVGTAQSGIPPFGLQSLGQDQLMDSDLPARINRTTANRLGVSHGDAVRLKSGQGPICLARILVDEGVMPGHVALDLGFGHTSWDQFNQGKGINAHLLQSVHLEVGSGISSWSGSRVDIEKTSAERS